MTFPLRTPAPTTTRSAGQPLLWAGAALVVAAAAVAPLVGLPQDLVNLLFLVLLTIVLGQSWNVLGGFVGQINLGHAAFFGVGAFVTRQLWLAAHLPAPVAFLGGGIASLAFGLIIGVPTFRLRGVYFAVGTLALAEALRLTVGNVFPTITTLPDQLTTQYNLTSRYELALGLAVVTTLAAYFLLRSRMGLGLLAVREDEEAARASGVNALAHKLGALALSSFFAGLAGSVYAFYQASYYAQATFDPSWTFDSIIITFVGGVGTIVGPIVGAIFYIVLRERLTLSFTEFHQVIFGLLFILVVLLLPGGLVDVWARVRGSRRRIAGPAIAAPQPGPQVPTAPGTE